MLEAKSLSAGYRGKAVVEGVELTVSGGEIVTLIGPNGSGKSTILKTLTRQLTPVAGVVCLDGADIAGLKERDLARTMAVLTTDRPKPELMTCFEAAAVGRYPYTGQLGILTDEDRAEVRRAMELVGAGDIGQQQFDRISDGQRQLVMLARAICQRPDIMVLDEPTSYLDIRHKLELLGILKRLVNNVNLGVVMSLHELDLAQKISDRIVCVSQGKILKIGTPEEIFVPGYVEELFGVTAGSFEEISGSMELAAPEGPPRVFVIGGGGKGIETYRSLQRQGIPFAAGVLHENDIEVPIVRAIGTAVTDRAFEPIGRRAIDEAANVMAKCSRVICCLSQFGTMNEENRRLLAVAEDMGIEVEYV